MKPTDLPKSEKPAEKLENEVIPAPAKVEEKIDFSNVEIEPLFADYVDFDTLAGLPCADGVCRAGGIWRTGAPPKGNCASRNGRLTWQKAGVSRLVLGTPTFLFHAKSTVIESQCRSFHAARYEKHGQKPSLAMISVRIFCLSGHWGWYAKPYWVMAYSISSGSNASLVCPSE